MKNILRSYTQGQSLVFFVFTSVVLIGILAFVLDMGYMYYMRRWAQNAADSAALAAARELCLTSLDPTDLTGRLAIAEPAGKYYAEERNLATNFAQNSTDISLLSAFEVEATVTITHPTIVAGFFGQEFLVVPAIAAAGCFEPELAKVVPISWKCRELTGDPDDPSCDIKFEDNDGCSLGDDFYYVFLWEDADEDDPQNFFCIEWDDNPEVLGPKQEELVCDYYDNITYFPDGVEDIEIVSPLDPEHSWSWINLIEGGQGNTSELDSVINNGSPNPINPPIWVYESGGVVTDLFMLINDLSPGDFGIPIFDEFCDHPSIDGATNDPRIDCAPPAETTDDIITKAGAIKKSYRIVGFAWLNIECVDAGSAGPCPGRSFLNENNQILPSIKSIEGCFKQGIVGGPAGHGNPGVTSAGAWTIYLTR